MVSQSAQSPTDWDFPPPASKKSNTRGPTPNPVPTSTPAHADPAEPRRVSYGLDANDAPSANALRESLLTPRHCLVPAVHSRSPQTHDRAHLTIPELHCAPARPPRCGTPRTTSSRPKPGKRAVPAREATATSSA